MSEQPDLVVGGDRYRRTEPNGDAWYAPIAMRPSEALPPRTCRLLDEIERLRDALTCAEPSCRSVIEGQQTEVERLRAELERFYPAEDVELFSPHIERACQKPPTLTVWFRDE